MNLNTHDVDIRSERTTDSFGIAEIHARAFTDSRSMEEVNLVDVLRHRQRYNPELSIVAEYKDAVVGHALFNPVSIVFEGEETDAVILAPVGVHPDFQSNGIGALMIEEGHQRAAALGFQCALLLGHSDYYPRFGYRTNMFGTCEVQVPYDFNRGNNGNITGKVNGAISAGKVEERRVQPEDIPRLQDMWHTWFSDTDLAIRPGGSIVDWLSNGTQITASAVTIDNQLAGYVRYRVDNPARIVCFLAKDGDAAGVLLGLMRNKVEHQMVKRPGEPSESITQDHGENGSDGSDETAQPYLLLPVHPRSEAAKSMLPKDCVQSMRTWDAAMIKVLNEENWGVLEYCKSVEAGSQDPGCVIWPVEFDIV